MREHGAIRRGEQRQVRRDLFTKPEGGHVNAWIPRLHLLKRYVDRPIPPYDLDVSDRESFDDMLSRDQPLVPVPVDSEPGSMTSGNIQPDDTLVGPVENLSVPGHRLCGAGVRDGSRDSRDGVGAVKLSASDLDQLGTAYATVSETPRFSNAGSSAVACPR